MMKKIFCTSQEQLDAIPDDFGGMVIIDFGTLYNPAIIARHFILPVVVCGDNHVEARGNNHVEAAVRSYVEAYDNNHVVARGNSHAEAYGNSHVVAYDSSHVLACGNSHAEAYGNSHAEAYNSSHVKAYGNSHAEAYNSSHVKAYGNAQITDASRNAHIVTNGNARVVCDPVNVEEYIDFYGLEAEENTLKLYKAVHLRNGRYVADWDGFEYTIGDVAVPSNGFCEDPQAECGAGIHLAYATWALTYGSRWADLAILECECEKNDILVPLYGKGKVRARKVKVLREVPLKELGW